MAFTNEQMERYSRHIILQEVGVKGQKKLLNGKVLIIADLQAAENQHLELAARNIPSVKLILPSNLNVKDVLEADFVVITESAVNELTERLK